MQPCVTFSLPRLLTDPPELGRLEAIEAMCKAASHMRAALENYDPPALETVGEFTIQLPPDLWLWANATCWAGTALSVLESMARHFPSIKFAMARRPPTGDAELLRLAEVRLDMRNAAVKEDDAWCRWAGEVGGRPNWNGHNDELRALVMDRLAERDATIKDLRELLEFKRAEISTLSRALVAASTRKLDDTVAE